MEKNHPMRGSGPCPGLARLCRKFAVSTGGVTIVEFALVATPFVALLIAILQTALVFLAQQVLQTATTQAARLILTGQAQTQKLSAAAYQQVVCADASALFSCNGLYVNVQTFASFAAMAQLNPLKNGAFQANAMNFSMGGPGDIVLVQVFYQWPMILGSLGFNLTNMNGNSRLLEASAAFRTEPY